MNEEVQCEILHHQEEYSLPGELHETKVGTNKLLRTGMVTAGALGADAVEMVRTESFRLRRLMEWIGKWHTEQEEAWLNPGSESPNVEASERSARSSHVRDT